MTGGQSFEKEYTFPYLTANDTTTSVNFMIQEQPQKDFAGATVSLKGENNEIIDVKIQGVNCRQLAQIMDVLEKFKGIIGLPQFEIPKPTPVPYDPSVYPWYPFNPYYPVNPFIPNVTWTNTSDDINKFIKTQTESSKKLNDMEHIIPTIDEDVDIVKCEYNED